MRISATNTFAWRNREMKFFPVLECQALYGFHTMEMYLFRACSWIWLLIGSAGQLPLSESHKIQIKNFLPIFCKQILTIVLQNYWNSDNTPKYSPCLIEYWLIPMNSFHTMKYDLPPNSLWLLVASTNLQEFHLCVLLSKLAT